MTLRQAIVVEVYPNGHAVDLVMLDDGTRHYGVQIQTMNGSTRSGTVDLPEIPKRDNKWDITQATGQDMIATVDFIGRNPVVTGFLYPQINQMLLKDKKTKLFRHQSDVTQTIDGDGNIQVTHPSGFYVRIGETTESDTLDGKYAHSSSMDRNQSKRVNIHIGMAGGVLELTLSKTGVVTLRCDEGVSIDAGQPVSIKAPSVTLDTPETTVTGNLTVQGDTSVQAIESRGHDISSTHVHTGVIPGGANTGTPP